MELLAHLSRKRRHNALGDREATQLARVGYLNLRGCCGDGPVCYCNSLSDITGNGKARIVLLGNGVGGTKWQLSGFGFFVTLKIQLGLSVGKRHAAICAIDALVGKLNPNLKCLVAVWRIAGYELLAHLKLASLACVGYLHC